LAKPVFDEVIAACRRMRNRKRLKLIDVGCSYGVNAALLKHRIDMTELYDLYTGRSAEGLARDRLTARDRRLFAEGADAPAFEVVGLDSAERAVAYAVETGILDNGVAADLEANEPEADERDALSGADLVISTGCIGYVGAPTFARILDANRATQPWLAHFVLRMFSFEPLRNLFKARGYLTEKARGRLFRQRRFASSAERAEVLGRLKERGVDVAGREAEGWLYAEFFLSRPVEEARRMPLAEIIGRG
jgi:predicted TPR repeat methyltransferase